MKKFVNYAIIMLIVIGLVSLLGCGKKNPTPTPTPPTDQKPVTTTDNFEAQLAPIRENISKDWGQDSEAVTKGREELKTLVEANKENVPLLAALVKENNTEMAENGIEYLGKLVEGENVKPEVVDALMGACAHKSDYIREKALWYLDWINNETIKTEKVIPKAKEMINDPSGLVRYRALNLLASQYSNEDVKKIVIEKLKDETPMVKGEALYIIGNNGDATLVKDILPLLKDESPYVRGYAAIAVGKTKDKEAMKEEVKLLDDKAETFFSSDFDNGSPFSFNAPDPTVAGCAVIGVENFSGQTFEKNGPDNTKVKDVEKCKEWVKSNLK